MLMDGEVRLFKRKHSKVWQVAFTLDGRQVRVSSKKRILNDAVAAAREIYLDYRFRQKNGLPVISKRFADVAALCRATMKQQLDNGVAKKPCARSAVRSRSSATVYRNMSNAR